MKCTTGRIVVAAVGLLSLTCSRRGEDDAGGEQAPKAPDGTVVLEHGAAHGGVVETSALTTSTRAAEVRAYAVVLDITDLVASRMEYEAARADRKKAKALYGASSKEFDRIEKLNANSKNVSDRTFEEASASKHVDAAGARASGAMASLIEASVGLRWGKVLASWMRTRSERFDRLLDQEDVLVKVTLPTSATVDVASAPQRCTLDAGPGEQVEADLLSAAPSADPLFQGLGLFYVAGTSEDRLVPGMSLVARLVVGPALDGVVIPSGAVVWWEGRPWAYVRRGEDGFARRQVGIEQPVEGGWFVTEGFGPGDEVVTRGAQSLLSQEFVDLAADEESGG